MRAGQLSNAAIVKLLRPFIVTRWHGAGEREMPDDVKGIWTAVALAKRSNVFMFALDEKGKLVHGFSAVRGGARGKRGTPGPQQEIIKARSKLKLADESANAKPRPVVLPDFPSTKGAAPAGVRMFVRPNGVSGGKQVVVELVAMAPEQWTALSYPKTPREIKPETLRAWLVQMYPPAIRTVDQRKPFKKFTATLRLRPAGADANARYAVLSGEVKLAKGDETQSAFEGRLNAVIAYRPDGPQIRSLQRTIEGDYLYRIRGRTQKRPLIAAIESRPPPAAKK